MPGKILNSSTKVTISTSTSTTTAKPKRQPKQRQSLAEKQPGTTIFPISRVKKIIKADKELDMMSNEAAFMVAVAAVCAGVL